MEKFYESVKNGIYDKGYRFENTHNLDEIVDNMLKKGVQFGSVLIEETTELDMQSFGSKIISIADKNNLSNYHNSRDYMMTMDSTYNDNDDVEITIYGNVFRIKTKNPNIEASDLYDDTKKNELDEMLSENKEESDTKGFQL